MVLTDRMGKTFGANGFSPYGSIVFVFLVDNPWFILHEEDRPVYDTIVLISVNSRPVALTFMQLIG